MLVIVILANGLLQNVMQPFAMGSALDLNPLVVLVITIASGCLFGMVGLILAAPLASAAVHITHDLSVAKAAEQASWPAPIVTQIEPAQTFYEAEDYHQQYLEKRGRSSCTATLARTA